MKIHQRHLLKGKDIKLLKSKLIEQFGENEVLNHLDPKSKVEWFKLENHEELIAIDDILSFWIKEGEYIPLLTLILKHDEKFKLKYIIVDKGAVPYITNGADIMRPGIIKIDPSIKKGNIVKIQEETYNKTIAIGKALFDATEIQSIEKGKVINNLHTINDEIWKFSKSF